MSRESLSALHKKVKSLHKTTAIDEAFGELVDLLLADAGGPVEEAPKQGQNWKQGKKWKQKGKWQPPTETPAPAPMPESEPSWKRKKWHAE
jgi:hypothetical protein